MDLAWLSSTSILSPVPAPGQTCARAGLVALTLTFVAGISLVFSVVVGTGAAVAAAESLGGLDLLIIDTGGRTEEGAFAAAKVSDLVVMPVQPSAVDLKSVPATCDLITMAGNPPIVAVLTREKPFGARHEETRAWLGAARIPVAQTSLGDRVTFQDAYAAGLGVGEFAPSSKAAQEIEKLFNEIAEQVGMQTIRHAGKTTCRGVAHGGQKTQSRRAG